MSEALPESTENDVPDVGATINLREPFRLGDWLIEPSLRQARQGETVVKIEPRNLRVLLVLASRPGETVSPRDIEALAWEGFVVTPDSLYQSIRQLRQVLGDTKSPATYIETVPRRGYRLVAEVQASNSCALSTEGERPAPRIQCDSFRRGGSLFQLPGRSRLALAFALISATGLAWTVYGPAASQVPYGRNASIVMPANMENLDVSSLRDLGKTARRTGRARESLLYLERALRLQVRNAGEHNEVAIELLNELAGTHLWLDEEEAAQSFASRALSLIDANAVGVLPLQASCTLVETLIAVGDYASADRVLVDAVAVAHEEYGDDQSVFAAYLTVKTTLRWAQGQLEEAEKLAREAVRVDVRARGEMDYRTAYSRGLLGMVLLDRGDLTNAEGELRGAIDVLERTTDQQHPYRLSLEHHLAEVLVKVGKVDEAEILLRRELAALEAQRAVDWRKARAMSVLAEAFIRRENVSEARHYLTLAKAKLTRTKGWPIEREARNLNARIEMLSALWTRSASVAKR